MPHESKLMSKPQLAVMAAGIGSRYSWLKQMGPVGPDGEIVLDYAIYDAVTHKQDMPTLKAAIVAKISAGLYPARLWD